MEDLRPKRKTRLGRVLLTRDAIVDAALAYVDEHGLEELSTRKLAAVLGVEAMTLYHHFATKGALLDALAERLTLSIELPRVSPGDDLIGAYVEASRSLYAIAARHPRAFVLLATRRANTPKTMAFYDALVAPLLEAGMRAEDAALVFRATGYFSLGAALARIATFSDAPEDRSALEHPERVAGHQHLRAVSRFTTRARVDALYTRGLAALAAGLRATVEAPRARRRRDSSGDSRPGRSGRQRRREVP
jgi:AcrR family transcriptional regulator